jgi:DNA polymerase-3 subunit epsilon
MKYRWMGMQRWRLSRKGFAEPMRGFLSSSLPRLSTPFSDVEFVALDIETTGLDAATADMLSVGWVLLQDGRVRLDTARSFIVRPRHGVGDSASVHGLTDTVVNAGLGWETVLDRVVDALAGRVLLVHHAGLDKALLDRMCQRRFGTRLHVPVSDTLELELTKRRNKHHLEDGASLRLSDLRDFYGLPRYSAHNCLIDAIATAELLIAMVAHGKKVSLVDVLT